MIPKALTADAIAEMFITDALYRWTERGGHPVEKPPRP